MTYTTKDTINIDIETIYGIDDDQFTYEEFKQKIDESIEDHKVPKEFRDSVKFEFSSDCDDTSVYLRLYYTRPLTQEEADAANDRVLESTRLKEERELKMLKDLMLKYGTNKNGTV